MSLLSFDNLANKFGEVIAYGHLEQIELASGLSPRQMTGIDPEIRLSNALQAQDALCELRSLAAA